MMPTVANAVKSLTFSLFMLLVPADSFLQTQHLQSARNFGLILNENKNGVGEDGRGAEGRRSFVSSVGSSLLTICVAQASIPQAAVAGIDVSGLRVDAPSKSAIASQLKTYDGSASARVGKAREAQASRTPTPLSGTTPAIDYRTESGSAATWAITVGGSTLRSLGLGLLNRYEGRLDPPYGSKLRSLSVSFDFPSDWRQLDRTTGGLQYVDQRNGDKLYVLRAPLPEGTTLATAPKSFFGDAIFDPRGSVIRSGTVVEGYRVSSSKLLNECPNMECSTRRRLLLKYDVVTGSGVQTVERRGLVDSYQVDQDVYMLFTSSNAVKFEAKGKERETVEAIVDSFRIES